MQRMQTHKNENAMLHSTVTNRHHQTTNINLKYKEIGGIVILIKKSKKVAVTQKSLLYIYQKMVFKYIIQTEK